MILRSQQFLALGLVIIIWTLACSAANVDGGWSPWSQYGTRCSEDCGNGTRALYRKCNNPEPQEDGTVCKKEDGQSGTLESKNVTCEDKPCITGYYEDQCDNCTVGYTYNITMCGADPCTYIQPVKSACNKWNKTTCPSPCATEKCPEYAVCKDNSSDVQPSHYCSCTMGYTLDTEKKACTRPPPTKPTKRPNPTMAEAQKKVATVISKTASSVLIAFVALTLIVFILLRVFTCLRVIQMNMEIALICAHILLLFPVVKNQLLCKIFSILIHFFFTACFNFMMLEALHMYAMVAYVVKSDGILTRIQNTFLGWGLSVFVMIFCICFEYDNYGGEYHCWLQMNTPLTMGELIPIFSMTIATITLTEAAGAADYVPLKEMDDQQFMSAQISQRTNLIILPFVIAHMIIGMLSEYEQNLPLYGIFSILNGVTGGLIFFLHCYTCEQVRSKFKVCCQSVSKKVSKK